jgi:hypothetical protein
MYILQPACRKSVVTCLWDGIRRQRMHTVKFEYPMACS